jgi:DHA2 family multidrug resistance protein
MANGTAIYNLLRNLGGSFGVAFVTTIVARKSQVHQTYLASHLSQFDRGLQVALHQSAQAAQQGGIAPSVSGSAGAGSIYGQLVRQASMLSFNDAFALLSIFMACILPLVFLMKRGRGDARAEVH